MMWLRAPYIGMNRHYLLHSGTKEISISTNIIQNSNLTVENKTIHLTSDTDISVNVITAGNYYIDVEGFMVLPRRESAKQFIIATGVPFSSSYPSEILIASYENTTSVSITFPRDLTGISIPNYTISVNLAAYKTYMLKSMYDLSGTYINSSHPISVIAGVRYSSTIYGYQSYLLEQVPPTNVLGTEYLVPPLQNHTTYILRTLSPSNHVLLKFYNSTGVYSFMVYRDLPLIMVNKNEPVFISSSQPIMVVQFGRAFMMTVPGISNYLRNYDFLVPTVKVPIVNYVCLISTNGNVLLDSKQPSGQSISFMNTTHGNFTIITTNITVGRHSITSTSGTTYFGAMLYGQYGGYGYGFPLGMGTTSGKSELGIFTYLTCLVKITCCAF